MSDHHKFNDYFIIHFLSLVPNICRAISRQPSTEVSHKYNFKHTFLGHVGPNFRESSNNGLLEHTQMLRKGYTQK